MVNDDEITFEKICEELEAYNSYKDGARKVKDAHAKEVMNDIADEELVHAGELSQIVEEVNPEAVKKVKEGYEEAKEMKKSQDISDVSFKDLLNIKKGYVDSTYANEGGYDDISDVSMDKHIFSVGDKLKDMMWEKDIDDERLLEILSKIEDKYMDSYDISDVQRDTLDEIGEIMDQEEYLKSIGYKNPNAPETVDMKQYGPYGDYENAPTITDPNEFKDYRGHTLNSLYVDHARNEGQKTLQGLADSGNGRVFDQITPQTLQELYDRGIIYTPDNMYPLPPMHGHIGQEGKKGGNNLYMQRKIASATKGDSKMSENVSRYSDETIVKDDTLGGTSNSSDTPIAMLRDQYLKQGVHNPQADAVSGDEEAMKWLEDYWRYVRSVGHGNEGTVDDMGGFNGFADIFYNPKYHMEFLNYDDYDKIDDEARGLSDRLKVISGRYGGGQPMTQMNKSQSSPADLVPSFESMMKYHDENNDKLKFEKSGGGTMTMNRTGISYLGTGKRWNGLYRVHDAVRDSETGQFTIKSTEVEGCTKKEVDPKISAHENTSTEVTKSDVVKSEMSETKTEGPKTEIKKSTNWSEML